MLLSYINLHILITNQIFQTINNNSFSNQFSLKLQTTKHQNQLIIENCSNTISSVHIIHKA